MQGTDAGPHALRRLIVTVALLLLGVVAAVRLPLSFLPSWSFPELRVELRLAETDDVAALVRTWLIPVELAVRSMGDTRSIAGSVGPGGASLRVRLAPGTDPRRKAARLESELDAVRRRLPANSSLVVLPVGGGAGDRAAVIWLEGAAGEGLDRATIDRLESLPEVRAITVAGRDREELRITPHPGIDPTRLQGALDAAVRTRPVGEARLDGRRLPVRAGMAGSRYLAALPVATRNLTDHSSAAVVALEAIADIEWLHEDAEWRVRFAGRRGRALLVQRETEASPLALRRALDRELDALGLAGDARLLLDEAAPLSDLLHRWLVAGAAAMLLAILLSALQARGSVTAAIGHGERWQTVLGAGLAVPAALAAALNALWIFRLPVDITTLPALWLGIACALLFYAVRAGERSAADTAVPASSHSVWAVPGVAATAVVSAGLLPLAVALAGGSVAPLLASPARAFLVTTGAAVLGVAVVPVTSRGQPPRWVPSLLRASLRHGWTLLLATVTVTLVAFALFGPSLRPSSGVLSPPLGDVAIQLDFPEGTTLDQAEARVVAVERHLAGLNEVTEHWAVVSRRSAFLQVAVVPNERSRGRLQPFAARLEAQLAVIPAAVRAVALSSGGGGEAPLSFDGDLEHEADTDEEATVYRFVLRGTDFGTLRRAEQRVLEQLSRSGVRSDAIYSDWGRTATRLELAPKPGVSQTQAAAAIALVARDTRVAPAQPLPGEREAVLRIVAPGAPTRIDDPPQRAALASVRSADAGGVVAPWSLLSQSEVTVSPRVRRQNGRFVLPVDIRLRGMVRGSRESERREIDRDLRQVSLPAGIDLELPDLNPFLWEPERVRMLAIMATLPALLLVLGACRLNSLLSGAMVAVPLTLAVATATPFVDIGVGSADELTLLGLGAVLCGVLPILLWVLAAAQSRAADGASPAGIYRWLLPRAAPLGAALASFVVLLALPGIGLEPDRDAWVMPLRAAAVTGSVAVVGGFLLLPAMVNGVARFRQRDRDEIRRRSRPPEWATPGRLRLRAHNLTKIYRDGFRALHATTFTLDPGIVGLLGPNGAGKTTLLRLLCGLLEPSRGRVEFRGVTVTPDNLAGYRRLVGFLPQDFNAYEGFTGERFLDYWALERGLFVGKKRKAEIERVLQTVGLEDAAGRKVRDYSGGMRRRIGIARALLGDPPILIVDEPTTGLDVEARSRLRSSLLAVAGERIIVFSTHIASDIAAAANRVLVLDRGALLYDGPANDLIVQARGRVVETVIGDDEVQDFSHSYRVTTRVRTLEGIRVRAVLRPGQDPPACAEQVEPNLEEAYLELMGEAEATIGEVRSSDGRTKSILDL